MNTAEKIVETIEQEKSCIAGTSLYYTQKEKIDRTQAILDKHYTEPLQECLGMLDDVKIGRKILESGGEVELKCEHKNISDIAFHLKWCKNCGAVKEWTDYRWQLPIKLEVDNE